MSIAQEMRATQLVLDELSKLLECLREEDKDELLRLFCSGIRKLLPLFDLYRPLPRQLDLRSTDEKLIEALACDQTTCTIVSAMASELAAFTRTLRFSTDQDVVLEELLQVIRWQARLLTKTAAWLRVLNTADGG